MEIQSSNRRFSADNLFEFAHLLNQQNDLNEILRIVAQKCVDHLKAENSSIQMLNPRTRETIKTVFKDGDQPTKSRYSAINDQICGWMVKNNEGLLTKDIKKDKRFKEANFADLNIRSVLAVKLQIEGVILGFLIVFNKVGKAVFDEEDVEFLEKIAILASPYLRNTQQIQDFFDTRLPNESLLKKYEKMGMFGKSKNFIEMLHSIDAAARCDVRVMLEGKSGTGKELIANAIHQFSGRGSEPFVAVDCGAIPEQLFESELFGHEKGAFTGANQKRIGLFEEANGGTLFMDEIANLTLDVQSKLMRVLQQKEIRPVGSNKATKINVRVISASSYSLQELVKQERFREDLFYRLHVYPIYVPKLNERKEDIAILANYFLLKFSEEQGKKTETLHEKLLDFMKQRQWSGNIRELENFVERLVTLAKPNSKRIELSVLPSDLQPEYEKFRAKKEIAIETRSLNERLLECEENILREALEATEWNQTKAARNLHMSEQNFRYRMRKLGLKKG